jgi:hypothetical protein
MPRCYARTKSIKYWAIIQSIFVHSKDAPYSSIPFPSSSCAYVFPSIDRVPIPMAYPNHRNILAGNARLTRADSPI